MNTECANRVPPCRALLSDMKKNQNEANWWQEEAVKHQSRIGECAQMESKMCSDRALMYHEQAQRLGDMILQARYPHIELPEAV